MECFGRHRLSNPEKNGSWDVSNNITDMRFEEITSEIFDGQKFLVIAADNHLQENYNATMATPRLTEYWLCTYFSFLDVKTLLQKTYGMKLCNDTNRFQVLIITMVPPKSFSIK
jgi:hypothetical protein